MKCLLLVLSICFTCCYPHTNSHDVKKSSPTTNDAEDNLDERHTPMPPSSVASPSTLLIMSGDSTMYSQFILFKKKLQVPDIDVVFFPVAGGHAEHPRSMPSAFSTCAHVTQLIAAHSSSNFPRADTTLYKKIVVYLNFGMLHLLHVHPHRPWVFRNSSKLAEKAYRHADFSGFFNLENW